MLVSDGFGGIHDGLPVLLLSDALAKPSRSLADLAHSGTDGFFSSCMNLPGAMWEDVVGEAVVPRFWLLGMPLAEAKLLAIEEDRSRALGRMLPTSRGGWGVSEAGGEVGLEACLAASSAGLVCWAIVGPGGLSCWLVDLGCS